MQSIVVPSLIKLQGTLFSTTEMLFLLLIPAIFKLGLFLTNKLSLRTSLHLPIIFVCLYPFIILSIKCSMKLFVLLEVIMNAIFFVVYFNRSVKITEYLKPHYNVAFFNNKQMSLLSIETISGFIIFIIFSFKLQPLEIIKLSIFVNFIITIPTTIIVNNLILQIKEESHAN